MEPQQKLNSKVGLLIVVGLSLTLLCVVVSWITASLVTEEEDWQNHDRANGHDWLRQELELTPAEAAAIDALNPAYREEKAGLQVKFRSKIEELRSEITSSDEFSDEARETIHELHVIHGQLQELSIRHYFQMMEVLPADKQVRLKNLAAEALSVPQ